MESFAPQRPASKAKPSFSVPLLGTVDSSTGKITLTPIPDSEWNDPHWQARYTTTAQPMSGKDGAA